MKTFWGPKRMCIASFNKVHCPKVPVWSQPHQRAVQPRVLLRHPPQRWCRWVAIAPWRYGRPWRRWMGWETSRAETTWLKGMGSEWKKTSWSRNHVSTGDSTSQVCDLPQNWWMPEMKRWHDQTRDEERWETSNNKELFLWPRWLSAPGFTTGGDNAFCSCTPRSAAGTATNFHDVREAQMRHILFAWTSHATCAPFIWNPLVLMGPHKCEDPHSILNLRLCSKAVKTCNSAAWSCDSPPTFSITTGSLIFAVCHMAISSFFCIRCSWVISRFQASVKENPSLQSTGRLAV